MRRLASDSEIDDEAVGFHAQQAIEKWIKAVRLSTDWKRSVSMTSVACWSSSETLASSCHRMPITLMS